LLPEVIRRRPPTLIAFCPSPNPTVYVLPLVQVRLMVWPVTGANPLTTGALPNAMLGVVMVQSLETVRLTVKVVVPLLMSRPRQTAPIPIPEQ